MTYTINYSTDNEREFKAILEVIEIFKPKAYIDDSQKETKSAVSELAHKNNSLTCNSDSRPSDIHSEIKDLIDKDWDITW